MPEAALSLPLLPQLANTVVRAHPQANSALSPRIQHNRTCAYPALQNALLWKPPSIAKSSRHDRQIRPDTVYKGWARGCQAAMVWNHDNVCRYSCVMRQEITFRRYLDIPCQQHTVIAGRDRQYAGRIIACDPFAGLRMRPEQRESTRGAHRSTRGIATGTTNLEHHEIQCDEGVPQSSEGPLRTPTPFDPTPFA